MMIKPYNKSFDIELYAQQYSGKTERHNLEDLIQRFELPISIDEGFKMVEEHEKKLIFEGVPLKVGAKELIQALFSHHIKIALATSSIKERADYILKRNHIIDYFTTFVYGSDVQLGKPHPDIFFKALDQLKISPQECLGYETIVSAISRVTN